MPTAAAVNKVATLEKVAITPSPKLELPKVKKIFTIGADIEFGYIDPKTKNFMAADGVHGSSSTSGIFGTDGNRSIAEIRPDPAYSPIKLIENIRKAFLHGYKTYEKTRPLKWTAGSTVNENPIGCHLHCNLKQNSDITDLLDKVLVPITVLLEHPRQAKTRRSNSYGRYADVRSDCSHGGFEYRTLSSFLHSKGCMLGIMALFHGLVDSYVNFGIKVPGNLSKNDTALKNCDKAFFKGQMANIIAFLDTLPYFKPGYIGASHYRVIAQMIHDIKQDKFPDPNLRDMRVVWQLDDYEKLVEVSAKKKKLHVDEILSGASLASLTPPTILGGQNDLQ